MRPYICHICASAHQRIGQQRKYNNQPYDVHLHAVAKLVASVTDDPEMIAAAWLHDTVEDTPATLDDIAESFGTAVAELVESLTDVSMPSDGNRANLARYRTHGRPFRFIFSLVFKHHAYCTFPDLRGIPF